MVRRLASETGSVLIEIVMSAAVLGILAVGVMSGFDVAAKTSGDSKHKAAAANIAENELERMRSLRMTELTAMTGTPETFSQNGVTYTRTAKAEWVSQPATGSICDGVNGPPTYLRLSVSVSWPGKSDKPVTVTSLLSPGARGTLSTQGALVIKIIDVAGNPVPGIPVSVGGGVPGGTTDSNGCVSWSPITAATYNMTASKSGYLTTSGGSSLSDSISVAGQDVTQRTYTYSQGASISGSFYSVRGGSNITSKPTKVSIANPTRSTTVIDVASDGTFSATVLPDPTNQFTVFAGACEAARPPLTYQTYATLGPGATVSNLQVRMPAIDPVTKKQGSASDGTVKITDVCGTTYSRPTTAASGGKLADPGFPYSASSLSVCGQVYWNGGTVSTSNYKKTNTGVAGNNFTGGSATTFDFDFTTQWVWGWYPFPLWLYHQVTTIDAGWSTGTC